MTEDACRLDGDQRQLVESTIAEHCDTRGWTLFAVNCRSNHMHVVVAAKKHPKTVRSELKAWCTRRLKEQQRQIQSGRCGRTDAKPCATRRAAGDTGAVVVRENWWAERGQRDLHRSRRVPGRRDPLCPRGAGPAARTLTVTRGLIDSNSSGDFASSTGRDHRWRFGFVCGSTRGLLRTAKDRNPRSRVLMLRYLRLPPELDISENGETPHNGRIIEISPPRKEPRHGHGRRYRYRVSSGGSRRWD